MASLFKCALCDRVLNTAQGLKSHITRLHRGVQSQSGNVTTSRTSSQTCVKLFGSDPGSQEAQNVPVHEVLANTKATRRIIRRIPKGARACAAEALAHVMEACVTENTDFSWRRLLVFSGECFQVPKKQSGKDVSLTTLVKHNIGNFVRKIPVTCQDPGRDRSKKNPRLPDDVIAKLVEAKIADGDITGAVRVMSSEDTLAPYDADTLNSLKAKHPSGGGFDDFPLISEAISPLQVSESAVQGALKSFPNGSSGGLDSLRPQHLKDLVSHGTGVVGERLLLALTKLCNHMLAGKVPKDICSVLYGASLCALNKKNGGIRPIAVGNTLRRLVAKVGGNHIVDRLGETFRPKQLGFGTRGGAEAASHAARRFVNHNHEDTKVLLKVDFLNAFNMVRRDRLLSVVLEELPEIYLFLEQCYRHNSLLAFGKDFISSQRGLQQGDPLGPALFCLMVNPIASALKSELNLWYLDDATLAGPVDVVLQDFRELAHRAADLGLEINSSKCERMILSTNNQDDNIINLFEKEIPNIRFLNTTNAFLLGAPLTRGRRRSSKDGGSHSGKSLGWFG